MLIYVWEPGLRAPTIAFGLVARSPPLKPAAAPLFEPGHRSGIANHNP